MQLLKIVGAIVASASLSAAGALKGPGAGFGRRCSRADSNVLSCFNTTAVDTCCSEYPSGLVLSTEYWIADGPKDSWTIHGLWPDFCDGTYPEYCDTSREYENPRDVIVKAKKWSLLKFMDKYWKTNIKDGVDDNAFWKHEFDKHGTCMSTLETKCYGKKYVKAEEEIDYFEATIDLFKKLDTYKTLKKCKITPSSSKTYALADVHKCLEKSFGNLPFVGCNTDGEIHELWYYHHLRGKILGGKYEPTKTTRPSNCPVDIKYPPKNRK